MCCFALRICGLRLCACQNRSALLRICLDDRSLPSFYSSWRDTAHLLWRGHIFEAAEQSRRGRFEKPQECHAQSNSPNIILTQHESMVPPSRFLNESLYDASLERLFRSYDGDLHNMRVDTYGGASWLTEFSSAHLRIKRGFLQIDQHDRFLRHQRSRGSDRSRARPNLLQQRSVLYV